MATATCATNDISSSEYYDGTFIGFWLTGLINATKMYWLQNIKIALYDIKQLVTRRLIYIYLYIYEQQTSLIHKYVIMNCMLNTNIYTLRPEQKGRGFANILNAYSWKKICVFWLIKIFHKIRIPWSNDHQNIWRHMASLDHDKLNIIQHRL